MNQNLIRGKKERIKFLLLLFFVLLLILIQMHNFSFSFRIIGDDYYYFFKSLIYEGDFLEMLKEGIVWAQDQGRIGHILGIPLSIWSNFLLEYSWFQWVILLLFAGYTIVAAVWLASYTNKFFAILMVIVYFSLLPVGLYHWPPNVYGGSMFYFVGFYLTRIALWYSRSKIVDFVLSVLLSVFTLISEYNMIILLVILGMEYFWVLYNQKVPIRKWLTYLISLPSFRRDIVIVLLVWGIYGIFYWLNPSQYGGTQMKLDMALVDVLTLQFKHCIYATSIPYIIEKGFSDQTFFLRLPWQVGLIVFFSLILLFKYIEKNPIKNLPIVVACIWGGLLSFLVTLPVALTPKYQQWCKEWQECTYIDGRIAYLGFATILTAFILLIYNLIKNKTGKKVFAYTITLIISFVATLTYAHNNTLYKRLKNITDLPFKFTKRYCSIVNNDRTFDKDFINGILSVKFFNDYGAPINKKLFFKKYLEMIRKRKIYPDKGDELLYNWGETLSFANEAKGTNYLVYGWSYSEDWGTWSDGDSALILIRLQDCATEDIAITMYLHPFIQPQIIDSQTILLKTQKCFIDTLTLRRDTSVHLIVEKNCLTIPYVDLHFKFLPQIKDSVRVKDLWKYRKLNVAIISMKLERR